MAKKKQTLNTGRRKTSVARIILKNGSGKILVNGKDYKTYFKRATVCADVARPLTMTEKFDKTDIVANVAGGGLSGQAGAVKHAIATALFREFPALKPILRGNGFLTRDSRKVERKLYGHKKARKSFQFSKR